MYAEHVLMTIVVLRNSPQDTFLLQRHRRPVLLQQRHPVAAELGGRQRIRLR